MMYKVFSRALFSFAALVLLLSIPHAARAHATTLWCYVENGRVYVEGFFMGGDRKVQNGKVIVVNDKGEKVCLLYTSPSPRDRTRSRMPSSA
mgnify:CR=1 FL=1